MLWTNEEKVLLIEKYPLFSTREVQSRFFSNRDILSIRKKASQLQIKKDVCFLKKLDKQKINELYKSGLSSSQVAKKLNCSKTTILRIVRKFGNIRIRNNMSLDQRQIIIDAYINDKLSYSEIAKKFNCSSVGYTIKNFSVPRTSGYSQLVQRRRLDKDINLDFFKTLTKESSYVLGLIFGDGNISKSGFQASVATLDLEIYEILKSCIGKVGRHCYKGKLHEVLISSKEMVDDLKNLYGLYPCKSHTMLWPILDDKFLSHFYRGLSDSDGSWCFIKNKWIRFEYCTVSKDFIKDFTSNLKRMLIIPKRIPGYRSYYKSKYNCDYNYFDLCGKEAKIFRDWIYKDSDGLRLTRKYNTAYSIDSLEAIQ